MEAEEGDQQQAAVTGTSDKHPLLTEECWLDEDYHVPGEAKVLPSDPWDDLPLPCDQRDDAVGRTAADHRVCAAEQPAGIAARMTPVFSQEQARSGEEEVQATTSRLGSRAELPSQLPADAEAPPQLQREAVSPAWQAFMKAIRSGGSQRKHKRERSSPPGPVSASAKADAVAADVPYEKDDWWFDRHLLDGDWLEEADWGEGEGDEVPGSESAPDAWWELDDFQDEQQDPWLWEAEEEPRHRRAARAKAADIVRLLDLHTAAGRAGGLRLVAGAGEAYAF